MVQTGTGKDRIRDNELEIVASGDATKKLVFDASAIATATTRTITMPDSDVDLSDVALSAVTTITTTPYDVLVGDGLVLCAASAASVVLPSAVTMGAGKRFIIKSKVDSVITLTTDGGTMDGEATLYLAVREQSLVLESDGTNYHVPYAYKTAPESVAMYSDSTTQTHPNVGGANDAYPVQFNATEVEHGLTRDNGGAGTTVSISNANPAVITWAAHGMSIGDAVYFTTDGALPTGLTANTKYYILTAGFAAGEFEVSTNPEGIAIATSDAGSGTQTGHDSSRICFTTSGEYLVAVSAIADSDTTNKKMELWANVDGANVARSNTIVNMPNANSEMIIAVTFIITATATSCLQLRTTADNDGVQMLATAAGSDPTRPACPSIIVTINKISK